MKKMGVLEEASLMTTDGLKASWLTYLLPMAFSQKFCMQQMDSAEVDSTSPCLGPKGAKAVATQLHAKDDKHAPEEHL